MSIYLTIYLSLSHFYLVPYDPPSLYQFICLSVNLAQSLYLSLSLSLYLYLYLSLSLSLPFSAYLPFSFPQVGSLTLNFLRKICMYRRMEWRYEAASHNASGLNCPFLSLGLARL